MHAQVRNPTSRVTDDQLLWKVGGELARRVVQNQNVPDFTIHVEEPQDCFGTWSAGHTAKKARLQWTEKRAQLTWRVRVPPRGVHHQADIRPGLEQFCQDGQPLEVGYGPKLVPGRVENAIAIKGDDAHGPLLHSGRNRTAASARAVWCSLSASLDRPSQRPQSLAKFSDRLGQADAFVRVR